MKTPYHSICPTQKSDTEEIRRARSYLEKLEIALEASIRLDTPLAEIEAARHEVDSLKRELALMEDEQGEVLLNFKQSTMNCNGG